MRLFAYGTLLVPEIFEALTGLRPRSRPAVLTGYERLRVRSQVYPAVVPAPGRMVPGRLLEGVPRGVLAFLDAFEGDEYRRLACPIRVPDGAPVVAWCWVWKGSRRRGLDDEPWDPEAFVGPALADYVRRCRRFGRGLRRGGSGGAHGVP